MQRLSEHQSSAETLGGDKVRNAIVALRDEYLRETPEAWVIGFSAGKDSTLVLHLVFEMLLELAPGECVRPVYVVANDTLVESPVYAAHFNKMLERLDDAAHAFGRPIHVRRTSPAWDQSFWANVIGRGYPMPSRFMRWCTDRLKIAPTRAIIQTLIESHEKVVLLLGVRRDESAARAQSAAKYDAIQEGRLNPHNTIKGCWVMRPILEFTTDDVWQTLLQRRPPWGGTHRDLITMYRNAKGGECPFVVDKDAAPSCGTGSARFGCWTCTVVEKDRSLQGLIDSGHEELTPLAEFTEWLREFSANPANRSAERRDGTDGTGGFNLDARQAILDRLRSVEAEMGLQLLSDEEEAAIRFLWDEETAYRTLKKTKRLLRVLKDVGGARR